MKRYRKIKSEICKCNYCGSTVLTVDDFGQCPKGCPGNMATTGTEETIYLDMTSGWAKFMITEEEANEIVSDHPDRPEALRLYYLIDDEIEEDNDER